MATPAKDKKTLRLLIREYMSSMVGIEKGSPVRCRETDRVGVVLEIRRGAVTMYARVLWNTHETTLTEVVDLQLIT